MNKIKVIFSAVIVIAFATFAPVLLSSGIASAQYTPPGSVACGGANGSTVGSGADCVNNNAKTLPQVVSSILNILSWVVGAVSIIMVIYGGFRYVTSGGGQDGVKAGKDTLLYAVIGLVIVALSQVIVNFVLKSATNAATGGN